MTIRQRSLSLLMAASAAVAVGLWLYEHPPFEAALTKPRVPRESSRATAVQAQIASISGAEAKVRLQKIGQMPLYFIENRGQLDSRVAFYVQGRDKTLYFTEQGITFVLTDSKSRETVAKDRLEKASLPLEGREKAKASSRWVVKLEFVGANPTVKTTGEDKTAAVISYFKGPREQWKTGLPTYSRIVYSDLWPGIDLVYSGTADRLKYSFLVKPGADPEQIRLAYRGVKGVRLNEAGQLDIETAVGGFKDDTPYAYQEVEGRRVGIDVAYSLDRMSDGRPHRYGFALGSYDRGKPLVLDPAVLVYAGFIGGSSDDLGYGIAVDTSGNAYITGQTNSTQATFPVVVGPDLIQNGNDDAFIAKVNSSGSALIYAGYIGGSSLDYGRAIAVDSSGDAYITGVTQSSEATFPAIVGPDLTYNGGGHDAFVAKVSATGTALLYAGYIGGGDYDDGKGIAVDSSGNAYVAGQTRSSEATFPATVGPDLTYNGNTDAFVAKVDITGTTLAYAGYIGGTDYEEARGIALDASGDAYIVGFTNGTAFPATIGPDLTYNGGPYDAFAAKVNAAGTELLYAGLIGGSGEDYGLGIAVDISGNAYVTGQTDSSQATFPVTVGPDLTYNGGTEAFVAKINATGIGLVYAGYIGGGSQDSGEGIAVDSSGDAYVVGWTQSDESTFPVIGGPDATFNGGYDAFVAKVKASCTGQLDAGYH
jgi:hypothetical protein